MAREILLRVDGRLEGARNMALDANYLELAEETCENFTMLRLYRWKGPTVSVGRHQSIEQALDLGYCRRNRIPIVRRPTGGRAVLHDSDLTYALISNDSRIFPIESLHGCYRAAAGFLKAGLEKLGLRVELAPAPSRPLPVRGRERQAPCFASPSRLEILAGGRKLVGSAQRRLRRSFLQHGSIPVQINYQETARILKFDAPRLKVSMISLLEAAGRPIDLDDVVEALKTAFQDRCSATLNSALPAKVVTLPPDSK